MKCENSPPELKRNVREPREIVIYARSFNRAQAALSLILDAFTVLECLNSWSDEFYAIPADLVERARHLPDPRMITRSMVTANLWNSCAVAAAASRKRRWAYALALYRLSTTIHANEPMDLDPSEFPYEQRSANLRDQVRFAYAIVTAYAVVETLGFALHQEAFQDGAWIPEKRREIEQRLTASGVDLKDTLIWQIRGPRTKLENSRKIPSVSLAPWSRHPVRDLEIDPVEAIAYLRWLRARASAHDVTRLAYLLSIDDVANAQFLARRLILSVIPWKGRKSRHSATL